MAIANLRMVFFRILLPSRVWNECYSEHFSATAMTKPAIYSEKHFIGILSDNRFCCLFRSDVTPEPDLKNGTRWKSHFFVPIDFLAKLSRTYSFFCCSPSELTTESGEKTSVFNCWNTAIFIVRLTIGFEMEYSWGEHFYMDSIKNDQCEQIFAHTCMKTIPSFSFLHLSFGILSHVFRIHFRAEEKKAKSISILLDLMLYLEQITFEQ